jgi:hypothetical protein
MIHRFLTCLSGHRLCEATVRLQANGSWRCRSCAISADQRYRQRRNGETVPLFPTEPGSRARPTSEFSLAAPGLSAVALDLGVALDHPDHRPTTRRSR